MAGPMSNQIANGQGGYPFSNPSGQNTSMFNVPNITPIPGITPIGQPFVGTNPPRGVSDLEGTAPKL